MSATKTRKILISVTLVFFIAVIFLIIVLSQFDLVYSKKIDVEFKYEEALLGGSLLLPEGKKPFPVVLFIHGDGAQNRFSDKSYNLVINAFLEKGIACFSWDKQGVGESSGNWLNQSMSERTDEAIAALKFLKKRDDIDPNKIGYMGFSQAGWVIPEIATKIDDPAFYIIVGGAINWLRQANYITRTRLSIEGFSETEIQQVLIYFNSQNKTIQRGLSYEDYVSFRKGNSVPKGYLKPLMHRDRFQFVSKNINSDVSESIANIDRPLLAIWGKDDLNVDAAANFSLYEKVFDKMERYDTTLLMYENATHGILDSKYYNYQLLNQWPIFTKIRYLFEGKEAYRKGYLDFLGEWVREKLH